MRDLSLSWSLPLRFTADVLPLRHYVCRYFAYEAPLRLLLAATSFFFSISRATCEHKRRSDALRAMFTRCQEVLRDIYVAYYDAADICVRVRAPACQRAKTPTMPYARHAEDRLSSLTTMRRSRRRRVHAMANAMRAYVAAYAPQSLMFARGRRRVSAQARPR